MANNLPPGREWKKGQSGNPLGAKLHNPKLRKIKQLTRDEMVEIGTMVLKGNMDDLRDIAKDGKATALKCMMAAVAVRTITKGDPHALNCLLDRLLGKVKDTLEVTGDSVGTKVTLILPSNGSEKTVDGSGNNT